MTLAEGLALEASGGTGGVRGRRAGRRALRRRRGARRARAARGSQRLAGQGPARRSVLAGDGLLRHRSDRASSGAVWSSGCSSSARARSTCSCARAPSERLEELIERWSIVAGAVGGRAHRARHRRPAPAAAGRREGAGDRAARQDHPLLPPRRRLRHDRAGRAQHGGQRRRHHPRGRTGARAGRQAPAPRLLDRGRRASTTACSTRTCSTRASACPRPTTARSSSPSGSCASSPTCPGGCTARGSWSATRRPARWTRSTVPTTSSRRSSGCATCCPSGCRSWGWTSATPTSCRSTGWRARSSTSRTSPTSTARPSTSPTPARSASTS